MPYQPSQPTLVDHLYTRGVRKVTVTNAKGEPCISFVDFPLISTYLYEISALLGRARRDRLPDLDKLVSIPGKPQTTIKHAQELARERLQSFGSEPSSFYIFLISGELEKMGLSLRHALKTLQKAHEEKIPLEVAGPMMKSYSFEGIGFGSIYPELTEKMYRAEHISLEAEVWVEACSYGLPIPGYWAMIPLEQEERVVLHKTADYTSLHYPELLDPLDLRRHLQY